MRRRFILWHIVALMVVAVGCGTESAPAFSTPLDTSAVADTIADADVSSPDTLTQDSLPGLDGGSTDSWTDVPGAPELPPVFVDCDVVEELECGDLIEEASNGGEGSTQVIGWYACQPEVQTQYAASPEKTYRFTANKNMWVTVKETSPSSIDLFSVRDDGEGCAGSGSACVAGHSESLVWEAQEGETFFVVLDDRNGGVSTTNLAVSCCEPSCEGRVCGSDGCGGSCGDCEESNVCDGGKCVEGSSLNCLPSVAISCGEVLTGETFLSSDTTASVDELNCADDSVLGPERAYSLAVQNGGLMTVSVTSEEGEVAAIFLLEAGEAACDPNACLTGGTETLAYIAKQNADYTLLVEGVEGANATYDISIDCCSPSCDGKECGGDGCGGSCGECSQDFVCMEGSCTAPPEPMCQVVGEVTCDGGAVEVELGAAGGTNTMFASACVDGDLSGSEAALSFTSLTNAKVQFSVLSKEFEEGVALTLLKNDGDGCNGATCLEGGLNELDAEINAGEPHFLVVDGLKGAEGKVTVVASCCTPSCPGKVCGDDGCGGVCGVCGEDAFCQDGQCAEMPAPTCSAKAEIGCGESLSGKIGNDAGSPGAIFGYSCNPFDYAGSEVAYAFSSPSWAKVQVTLKPDEEAGELDLFLLGDADGLCESGNCKAWGDTSLSFTASAEEVSYLLVDGFMGAWGNYELHVDCCYPTCEDKVCGEYDGCGGMCGCDGGGVCSDGVCLEPAKGNSCMNPWLIQNLPYTKSSSTDGIFNDSVNTGGGCDSVFGVGEGVTDVVYEFKPMVTGDYLVELEGLENGASPSVLYAVNDCEEPESACVGYTDTIESGSAALQVTLESDKVVYIVVDGVAASDIGAFTFSMTGPL